MSKVNLKYLSFLAVLVTLYLAMLYFMPQRFNWTVTYYQRDKNPFGAYVFKSLADKSWIGQVNTSNRTIFELRDFEEPNLLVICNNFDISDVEMESILQLLEAGKTIFIASSQIDTLLTSRFGIKMSGINFEFLLQSMWGGDSAGVSFGYPHEMRDATYWLPRQLLNQSFVEYDPNIAEVIAKNTDDDPVLLKVRHGGGILLLSSTPMVFANFSMLKDDNYKYVAGMLSDIEGGKLHWTEYYQLGRMEAQTPLRYILSEESLKWAFYIAIFSIIIFMIFESKRTQRIIPIITPLKNETLVFVKTIARLYYQKKDHKQLANKKMIHFLDHLKQKLRIDVNEEIGSVINTVAAKTGSDVEEVRLLFDQINRISNVRYISADELKIFVLRIEAVLNENYKL